MNEIMEKIKYGILDLFPEIGRVPITAEMCLGAIPNYDSMAAVNLQTFLEENFPLKVSLDMLTRRDAPGRARRLHRPIRQEQELTKTRMEAMDLFGIFSAMMDVQRSWEDRPLELARMQADLLLKLQEATTEETASS